MRSFHLKIADHEEGPYAEAQIAQMFADRRIDRNTSCKRAEGGDWKTVDDYLPMLKYGTQLPSPSQARSMSPQPPPVPPLTAQRISIVDFDIPFLSVLKIMFKWMAAAFIVGCCFLPVIFAIWLIVASLFAALISGAMSSLHHP